jgi:hypothetical protein
MRHLYYNKFMSVCKFPFVALLVHFYTSGIRMYIVIWMHVGHIEQLSPVAEQLPGNPWARVRSVVGFGVAAGAVILYDPNLGALCLRIAPTTPEHLALK